MDVRIEIPAPLVLQPRSAASAAARASRTWAARGAPTAVAATAPHPVLVPFRLCRLRCRRAARAAGFCTNLTCPPAGTFLAPAGGHQPPQLADLRERMAKLEGALDGFLAGASLQHRAAGSHQFSAAVRGVLSVKAGVLTVSKLNNGTKALPLEFEIINTASNVGAAAWGSTVVGGGPDDDNGGGGGGVSDDRAEQAVLSALEGSTEGEPVIMSEVRETVQGRRKFNGRQWKPYRAAVRRRPKT